jgi:predicted Rossmann fold nucleotide-binding protein DprA/Smf involved in DNA uptake
MEELRIAIVGSRRRNSFTDSRYVKEIIEAAIKKYPGRKIVIVSGACPKGADAFAAMYARILGVELVEFPIPSHPPVKHRGEFAQRAYDRNKQIAEYCHVLFALVHRERTGGTENAIQYAHASKKKVFLVDEDGGTYLSQDGQEPDPA